MSNKEKILANPRLITPKQRQTLEVEFDVTFLNEQADPDAFLRQNGSLFTGLVTSAGVAIDASLIDALPALKVVSSFGVGIEHLQESALAPRQIRVGYTPDVLNDCVADLAFGLMLDVSRGITASDRYVREGKWPNKDFAVQRRISGKKLGILGMGRIGKTIARRASGFDMEIGYHNRQQRDDVHYTYLDSPVALAQWADYLMVAAAGGAGTVGLVDAKVLDALGPEGFLINISRGSVIDEAALIAALQNKKIAAAGLDVFANEPHVPDALMSMENVVLTPHIASGTQETREAMANLVLDNLRNYYATGEVLQPVPWAADYTNTP